MNANADPSAYIMPISPIDIDCIVSITLLNADAIILTAVANAIAANPNTSIAPPTAAIAPAPARIKGDALPNKPATIASAVIAPTPSNTAENGTFANI